MTWTRTHLALVGLLVVQLGLIAVFNWPGSGQHGATQPRTWLEGLDPAGVQRIVIEDDQDGTVELQRSGEEWTLPAQDGYPADGTKVRGLLEELAGIQVRAPVVQHEKFHESLEVTEEVFRHRVRIWGGDESSPVAELYVGTSPQYRIHHARRAGDDAVYEITGISAADLRAEPADWADEAIVDVDPEDVVRLRVSNEQGTLTLERERGGEWKVAEPKEQQGFALDPDAVGELVSDASRLDAAEPVGAVDEAAQGFADPAAEVELVIEPVSADDGGEEADGQAASDQVEPERERIVVRIGDEHPERSSQRYATASTLGLTATVWTSNVKDLLEADLEALAPEDAEEEDA